MDVSVPAQMLPDTRSPYLRNVLVGSDRVHLRGGYGSGLAIAGFGTLKDTGGTNMADPGLAFPIWAGQYAVLRTYGRDGLPASSAFAERYWPWETFEDPDPALITTAPPAFGRVVYYSPTLGGSQIGAGAGANIIPSSFGPHAAFYNDALYAITTGNDSGLYLKYPVGASTSRYHRMTIIAKLGLNTGTQPVGPAPATGTFLEAPRFCQGLAVYAQRLWALGGIPSSPQATTDTVVASEITGPTGGTAPRVLKPNTAWYTNINGDPMTDAAWRTNGVLNSIVIGAEGTDDYGMGLTAATKFMVIHKKRSTWVLTGTGLDSFAVKQVSATAGLADPRARLVHEDVVYWVSRDGLQSYDGVEVLNLSGPINQILKPAIDLRAGSARQSGSFVSLEKLSNSYLLLHMGRQKLYTNGTETVDQSWLYHIPTGRWVVFFSDIYSSAGVPTGSFRTGDKVWHILAKAVQDATPIAEPLLHATASARANDNINSGLVSFPAEVYFPVARLVAPYLRAAVDRYGIEAVMEFSSSISGSGRLQSQLLRHAYRALDGQEPVNDLSLTSLADIKGAVINASLTPVYRPAISEYDVFGETTDVQVVIAREYTQSAQNTGQVWQEIIGAYVEWRATHQRSS